MKELDLTKGSVPKVLMQFAMPYLLANVLQALYGGADLFVVGRFDDAASVPIITSSQANYQNRVVSEFFADEFLRITTDGEGNRTYAYSDKFNSISDTTEPDNFL